MGTLTQIAGTNTGRVVSLRPEQTTLGRSPKADFHLLDDGVSRKHARICWANNAFVLEDLSSQNGTFVDGKRAKTVALQHGSVIRLGPTATLRFCWMDTHQKQLLEELYETSVRDPLTGAFNRRHFAERLATEVAYVQRHSTALSLLLLDIDYFKTINDHYGHPEGDRVLKELTDACHTQLRAEDVFARYGGEEFAVLLRGVPLIGAIQAAERLRTAIKQAVVVGSPPLAVTVSVGCASLGCAEEATPTSFVQVADQRLYEAKQAGRDRVISAGYFSRD
jgi:diguanylate cyclase (GGDEF)-like protein